MNFSFKKKNLVWGGDSLKDTAFPPMKYWKHKQNISYRRKGHSNLSQIRRWSLGGQAPPIPPQSSFFQVISADILYIFKFELYRSNLYQKVNVYVIGSLYHATSKKPIALGFSRLREKNSTGAPQTPNWLGIGSWNMFLHTKSSSF